MKETVSNGVLTVSDNILPKNNWNRVTYICTVTYRSPDTGAVTTESKEIDFMLTRLTLEVKSVSLSGTHIFRYTSEDNVSPQTIYLTASLQNTSVSGWYYQSDNAWVQLPGADTNTTIQIAPNSDAFVNNADYAVIRVEAESGNLEDTFTIYKIRESSAVSYLSNEDITFSSDAAGQVPATTIVTNVIAYDGLEKVTPQIGTITGAPTGMTVSAGAALGNEIPITITIAGGSSLGSSGTLSIPVTYPLETTLSLAWSKFTNGADVVIGQYQILYNKSADGSVPEGSDYGPWTSDIPVIEDGEYLYANVKVTFSDEPPVFFSTGDYVSRQINTNGRTVTSIIPHYQTSTSGSTPPEEWEDSPPLLVPPNRYLWTYETMYFESGEPLSQDLSPHILSERWKQSGGTYEADGVVFSVITPNGNTFLNGGTGLTLTAVAYNGIYNITSSGAISWEKYISGEWTQMQETTPTILVAPSGIVGTVVYRCTFTYQGSSYKATASLMDTTDMYTASVESSRGDILFDRATTTTLMCRVYKNGEEMDEDGTACTYAWYRLDKDGNAVGSASFGTTKSINVNGDNIDEKTTFICEVTAEQDSGVSARGQITIRDSSDVVISDTEPLSPYVDMLWLDTSESPET